MPTVPLETRIDVKDLALLINHYKNKGIYLTSKSALIRQAVIDFLHVVSIDTPIPSMEEAVATAQKLGITPRDMRLRSLHVEARTEEHTQDIMPATSIHIPDKYKILDKVITGLSED